MGRSSAFTLIEVMIAVIVMGLLVGMVSLSFSGPIDRARGAEALEQVRYVDASARELGRRSGKGMELVFDLDEGTISRRGAGDRDLGFTERFGTGVKMEAVMLGERTSESGETVVRISDTGMSGSYAVKLAGKSEAKWVVVAGLSGESVVVNTDEQARTILSTSISARRHAD